MNELLIWLELDPVARFEPMPFDLSQLLRLMVGHDESIQVGMIEDRVMKRIGWRLPYVYLHHKYCLKILKDHPDITPIEVAPVVRTDFPLR